MSKTYYSEYVNHCLRFYVRHPNPKFHSAADKSNWFACENALKSFMDSEKDILLTVYGEDGTIAENICRIAKDRGIKQDSVWKLINELERKVAKRRGLL